MFWKLILFLPLLIIGCSKAEQKTISSYPQYSKFVHDMQSSNISEKYINQHIGKLVINEDVLYKITHPAEARSWQWYRNLLITNKKIQLGHTFIKNHMEALNFAENTYHVPKSVIVSILGIESEYGRFKGNYSVAQAIATIGFGYERRSAFFLDELKTLLELSTSGKIDIDTLNGSYAGAFGMGQFMPDSYRDYAVGYHKETADLINSFDDNIVSVANYLHLKGQWNNEESAREIHSIGPAPKGILKKDAQSAWYASESDTFNEFMHNQDPAPHATGLLVMRESKDKISYWLTFHNFNAIKSYNNSDYYALVVSLLSKEFA